MFCCKAIERFREPAIEDVAEPDGVPEDSLMAGREEADGEPVQSTASETAAVFRPFSRQRVSWTETCIQRLIANDPRLLEVELQPGEHSTSVDDVRAVLDALRRNHVVRRLLLHNMEVDDDTAVRLACTLHKNSSIRTLQLDGVTGRGVAAVSASLASKLSSCVHALHINDMRLTADDGDSIRRMLRENQTLAKLHLGNNHLDPTAFNRIVQGLAKNQHIRLLDLIGNALDDVDVAVLSRMMSRNRTIEHLCLDFNAFGAEGVSALSAMLSQNDSLRELHLFGNCVDAGGAKELSRGLVHNTSLRSLVLSFNKVSDEGAAAIGEALTVNSTLRKLNMGGNFIGNAGVEAFGRLLPRMQGLRHLNFGDFFDDSAVQTFVEGLRYNLRLSVVYLESPAYDDEYLDAEMEYYLRLNTIGRSVLLHCTTPRGLWGYMLGRASKQTDSASSLYYMLREKPEIFERI